MQLQASQLHLRQAMIAGAAVALVALGACRTASAFVGGPLAQQGVELGPNSRHLRASAPAGASASSSSSAAASIVAPIVGLAMVGMIQAAGKKNGLGKKPRAVARRVFPEEDVKVINPMFDASVWQPDAWTPGSTQTRAEWYRKVQRIGPELAVFDVTIPKPLGIKIDYYPAVTKKKGVGIAGIQEGGNTDKLNVAVCIQDGPGMWVLEGDRIMAIDGEDCEDEPIGDITQRVVQSEGDSITLTLMRNTRKGPIRVVMLPEGKMSTVKRGSRLSVAAEYSLGRELKFGCVDGWCGTCWHRERSTNGVFKPCSDLLTGDWDNTMPLALYPKPERAGDSSGMMLPRGDGAA